MTEAPEHQACRDRTAKERRGVEAALDLWRLGDSNWRNLYVGTRHVGVIWEPGLPQQVVAAMNGDPARDERLREDERRKIAGERAAELATRDPGKPTGPSQCLIDCDAADPDALRAEVRRLDGRLQWMHTHYDDQATTHMLAMFRAADMVAEARAQGRREADNAITWDTTCVGCAARLDGLYAERCAGMDDAVRGIEAALRARGLSEAADIARAWVTGGPERHGDGSDRLGEGGGEPRPL
jgi:hypothetical protein